MKIIKCKNYLHNFLSKKMEEIKEQTVSKYSVSCNRDIIIIALQYCAYYVIIKCLLGLSLTS